MATTICVLQEDMDEGVPQESSCCAIAVSLVRQGCRSVDVMPSRVSGYDSEGNLFRFQTSPEVRRFIALYDNDEGKLTEERATELKPICFEADATIALRESGDHLPNTEAR